MNAIAAAEHRFYAGSLPALVTAGGSFKALPEPVRKAAVKLVVAFPAGAQSLSVNDGHIRMDLFAEAVDGFPMVVVTTVLKWFLFNNPNNPFGPTPQDIREACELDYGDWVTSVVGYASGEKWRVPWPGLNRVLRGLKPGQRERRYEDCPAPWVDGCHLSPATVKNILRKYDRWKKAMAPGVFEYRSPAPDELFNRVPHDVFEPGERDEMQKRRAEWYGKKSERQDLF